MKRRVRVLSLLLVLVLVLALAACGKKETAEDVSPSPSPSGTAAPSSPSPEVTPVPGGPVNPLTGEAMDEEKIAARPIAIMLNNIKQALPQLGNSQADIIYEVLAEGGITRLLGVYQSVEGVGEIGSVRSSRPYYLELALGLDAIYMHAGGSEAAYANIKNWNVTALDCVRTTAYSGVFWRDQGRIKKNGLEHSVLTSGEAITEHFPDYSFRQTHEEGFSLPYTYAQDLVLADGEPANTLTVPFSRYKTGVFRYDEETKKYLVEEYGAPFIDGNTGEQLAFTNVVVIRTGCRTIDDYGRMAVDLSGYSGDGIFAVGGKYIPITWEKEDLNSPIVYKTPEGEDVTFAVGNCYVNIIPDTNDVTVE